MATTSPKSRVRRAALVAVATVLAVSSVAAPASAKKDKGPKKDKIVTTVGDVEAPDSPTEPKAPKKPKAPKQDKAPKESKADLLVEVDSTVQVESTVEVTPAAEVEDAQTTQLPLGSMYHVVDQIGARALWEQGITGKGVNVAMIDTGVANVPALSGADKVVALVDLSADSPETTYLDTYGHGTHMAGIIGGRDPGADPATSAEHPEWFLGVAPDAGLISVKVGDDDGKVDVLEIIAGVDWVTDHAEELDIGVLNLSFSSSSADTYLTNPLTYAIERAWHAGIVVVVAAGNDGLGQLRLGVPANDPYVIAVGGLEANKQGFEIPNWATNGNYLRNPDVGAPGAHIDSLRSPGSVADTNFPGARVDDDLFRGSGSSQAAAVTSGAVALLLEARPLLTPDEVKALLNRSANSDGLPRQSALYAGNGLLQVDAALAASTANSNQRYFRAMGTGGLIGFSESVGMILGDQPDAAEPDSNEWVGSDYPGTRWVDGVWDGSHWSGSHWSGREWAGAHWSGSHWSGSNWSGVDWAGSHWSGSHWSGSHWSEVSWSGSHWSGSHWSGSHWSNAGWE